MTALMHPLLRVFSEQVAPMGWTFAAYRGDGRATFVHENGCTHDVSPRPGYVTQRAEISLMRPKSGFRGISFTDHAVIRAEERGITAGMIKRTLAEAVGVPTRDGCVKYNGRESSVTISSAGNVVTVGYGRQFDAPRT